MSVPPQIYRWSSIRGGVWISLGVMGLALGRFVWEKCDPNFVPPDDPDAITGNGLMLLAGIFFVAAALMYWLSYFHVAVDDAGIATGIPGFGSKSLTWPRITRIREINGGLKLYGQPDDRTLTIASIVDEFGAIRDEILRRCPDALDKLAVSRPATKQAPLQLPLRARVGWMWLISEAIGGRLLMAVAALGLVALGVIVPFLDGVTLSAIAGSAFALAFGLLVGYAAWQPQWYTLVVERDRIELKSLGQTRVIFFVELEAVALVTEQTTYHGIPLRADSAINLVFPDGKVPITLSHFKFPNGVIHAHGFIKELFEARAKGNSN